MNQPFESIKSDQQVPLKHLCSCMLQWHTRLILHPFRDLFQDWQLRRKNGRACYDEGLVYFPLTGMLLSTGKYVEKKTFSLFFPHPKPFFVAWLGKKIATSVRLHGTRVKIKPEGYMYVYLYSAGRILRTSNFFQNPNPSHLEHEFDVTLKNKKPMVGSSTLRTWYNGMMYIHMFKTTDII